MCVARVGGRISRPSAAAAESFSAWCIPIRYTAGVWGGISDA
jgi:hypothetical protein